MLLFFGKDLYLKAIESDGFHKIALFENRMRELTEFADVLFQNDRTRKIKRLTQLVEDRHPAR